MNSTPALKSTPVGWPRISSAVFYDDAAAAIDPYAVERVYWESLWHEPKRIESAARLSASPP